MEDQFKIWLADQLRDARNKWQEEAIRSAAQALESGLSFTVWAEAEHHRLKYLVLDSFNKDDRDSMMGASYQSTMINTIKAKWDNAISEFSNAGKEA